MARENKKGQSVRLLICASFVPNPCCSIYKGQPVLICKVSVGRCTQVRIQSSGRHRNGFSNSEPDPAAQDFRGRPADERNQKSSRMKI